MNRIVQILIFLISVNSFSQEELISFDPEFKIFLSQCYNIGQQLIDKNEIVDLNEWYEGEDLDNKFAKVQQLKSDFLSSELEITYHLVMMNEDPLIYNFTFYNKDTKSDFGLLIIGFKDRENNFVDYINTVSKATMDKGKIDLEKEPKEFSVPPPPPPPLPNTTKKKNGNR